MSSRGQNIRQLDSTLDTRVKDEPSSDERDYPIFKAETELQRKPLLPYGLDAVAEFTYGPDFWNHPTVINAGDVAFPRRSPPTTEGPIPTKAEGGRTPTDTSDQVQVHIKQETISMDDSYTEYVTKQQEQQKRPAMIHGRDRLLAPGPKPSGSDAPGESSQGHTPAHTYSHSSHNLPPVKRPSSNKKIKFESKPYIELKYQLKDDKKKEKYNIS
ncbi:hypothetical protein F4809DRAFT_643437 [Biscogniauxia mediterranea]|nr:hypothetical protein F4809DRAFT_643437 [Biscogniauxia mediterranea]